MNCYVCQTELIWGGDHDITDEDSEFVIETNLHCPKCDAEVLVYIPKDKENVFC